MQTEFLHSDDQSLAKSNLIYEFCSWTQCPLLCFQINVIWKVNTSSIFDTFPNTLYVAFLIIILKKCNAPAFPSSPTSSFLGHHSDAIILCVCQDMKESRGSEETLYTVASRGLKEADGHSGGEEAWRVMNEEEGSVN